MAISSTSSGLRAGVCTSTTRPTAPYTGQIIYETDTNTILVWTGSTWAGPSFPSSTSIGSVSATEMQYLDGVTSPIQNQINLKANTASPTLTGTTTVSTLNITSSYQLNGNTLVNLRWADIGGVPVTASVGDFLCNLPSGVDRNNFVSITPVDNFDNNIVWIWGWALGNWSGVQTTTQIRIRASLGNGVHLASSTFRVYYRG